MHERGWRSIYIPVTLAVGNAPETIEDYTKQQMRWATGGFEILLNHNPLSPRRNLTADQRVQYMITATHYLVGIVPLLLIAVPPMEIFFDLRPVNLTVTWFTWLLFYFGFYGLQIMLAFTTMGSFRPETLMLASVSFPIYLRALVDVLINRQQGWHVTGGTRRRRSPFNFMIPQVLTFTFLALTSVVAVYKDLGNETLTLATAWNLTNTVILGAFLVAGVQEVRGTRLADAAARQPVLRLARGRRRSTVLVPDGQFARTGMASVAADSHLVSEGRAA
jgi:cellulose synthase (UDP-forming)